MQTNTNTKRIGILRGGAGKHYASSLKKGGEIILHISENLSDKYKIIDILIDKNHIWHLNGTPINPGDLAQKVDLVWNISHPSLSNILNSLSIPNIGASSFTYVLENSKEMLREHMKEIGVCMPRQIFAPKTAKEIFEKFGSPWIVKNYNEINVVKTFDELAKIISDSNDLTVEEFIAGKVASVHSVPKFRGEDIYIFPIITTEASTTEARPQWLLSLSEKEMLFNIVKNLHQHIGARHYLKSDFILSPRGKVYLLQINGIPDLKPDSHFSQICESVGAKMHHVVEHILEHS